MWVGVGGEGVCGCGCVENGVKGGIPAWILVCGAFVFQSLLFQSAVKTPISPPDACPN